LLIYGQILTIQQSLAFCQKNKMTEKWFSATNNMWAWERKQLAS